ncbi:MAG TPA: DUF5916 domain-containing protein [Vicinamibacterales bacterium]|nr:DUF5916 domain-containing protein [Vicinamibacterales bacterium]
MSRLWPCFIALSMSLCATAAAAQGFDIKTVDPETFRAIAFKISDAQRPDIDGTLTEEAWALAPSQGHFIQREPAYGSPSTEPTQFKILYDEKNLYIGVWVWDSEPGGIMGSEMKRDAGLNKGDQVKITIDTFHDHRNAFYFSTNPLGAYKDANTIENGRTINYDWNAVWNNKTTIDDKGWYIEIEIPLSQLRFRTTIGEATWGLNLCRILFRKNEESYWVPFPREWGASGFARVSNAGVLEGLKDLKARRRIEFVPFVSPAASRDYLAASDFDADAKYGGDFKIGLTNDLIADFTYHTDFAQVEADQEVVNLTRFSLFFPEKRQFFTETAGIFDFGKSVSAGLGGEAATNDPGLLNLFYSRRIGLVDGQQVPIIGGGRLTGRVGDYAIGVMNIATDKEALATREIDSANFTVMRLKRNVLRSSNIGALFVNSADGISEYNRAIGIDGGFVLGPRVSLTTVMAKTFSQGSGIRDQGSGIGDRGSGIGDQGSGKTMAGVVDFAWKSDKFTYGGQYLDVGEKFNAEMGYIPRLDIRAGNVRAGWTPRPKFGGIRQMTLAGSANYYENHAGVVDSRTQGASVSIQRQDTSGAGASVWHEYDNLSAPFATAGTTLPPGNYSWTYGSISYSSNRTRRMYGSIGVDVGGYYNGDRQTVRGNFTIQAGKTLLFEPVYTHNRVVLPGRPVYSSNVLNFRVSHSFSPDFYLKGFVQYNDDRKSASFNFLWWYHYKPGSDLYVVYNQGWDIDLPLTSREALENSYRVRQRSLAVKMTYWLAR